MTVLSFPNSARRPTKSASFDDSSQPPRRQSPSFICQETEPANGGNVRGGVVAWFLGVGGFALLGQLHWTVGLAWFTLCMASCIICTLKGMPDFYRKADCLLCDTEVKIAKHKKGGNCPGCQTRLVLKNDQFQYMELRQE